MSRLYRQLPTQLWMLSVSVLPIPIIISNVTKLSRFFSQQIVWHPHSVALLWRELGSALNDDAFPFKSAHNTYRMSAILKACFDGAPSWQIQVLIDGGSDVHRDFRGSTPLYLACVRGKDDVVTTLLQAKACPLTANWHGITPLMAACIYGRNTVIATLLKDERVVRNINRVSPQSGLSALTMSTILGRESCVIDMLVAAGATYDADAINDP